MKLIINKSQYSLLVEETVPNISDTREEIKKYCSPVKVSANIINSNMDKFININQFNIFFDEKANEYLSKWNKKDAGKVNKLLNMSELLNETKKAIGPSIVNMCRKYILATFGYKPSINIGQEMEKIIQVIFDNLYKKFTDNLVINTAVRIAVTKENVDKVKIGADNFMNSIVYNLDLVKDKMIFDAYLPIVDEHDKDRKSTRLNSSHVSESRMPSSA